MNRKPAIALSLSLATDHIVNRVVPKVSAPAFSTGLTSGEQVFATINNDVDLLYSLTSWDILTKSGGRVALKGGGGARGTKGRLV